VSNRGQERGGGYKYPEGFRKKLEVYNLHRAVRALRTNGLGLIMVEDFFDLFRLYEAGYQNVIAPMGGWISDT
jgi:DNA primase